MISSECIPELGLLCFSLVSSKSRSVLFCSGYPQISSATMGRDWGGKDISHFVVFFSLVLGGGTSRIQKAAYICGWRWIFCLSVYLSIHLPRVVLD